MNKIKSNQGSVKLLIIPAVLILLFISAYLYMQANTPKQQTAISDQPTNNPAGIGETTITPATTEESNVQVIKIEAGSYYYKPNIIRVKKDQKIRLEMTSVDMLHDLVIEDLNLQIPLTPNGKTNNVEFTPTKVGEFEFYCSVSNHRQEGQVGTLI